MLSSENGLPLPPIAPHTSTAAESEAATMDHTLVPLVLAAARASQAPVVLSVLHTRRS